MPLSKKVLAGPTKFLSSTKLAYLFLFIAFSFWEYFLRSPECPTRRYLLSRVLTAPVSVAGRDGLKTEGRNRFRNFRNFPKFSELFPTLKIFEVFFYPQKVILGFQRLFLEVLKKYPLKQAYNLPFNSEIVFQPAAPPGFIPHHHRPPLPAVDFESFFGRFRVGFESFSSRASKSTPREGGRWWWGINPVGWAVAEKQFCYLVRLF